MMDSCDANDPKALPSPKMVALRLTRGPSWIDTGVSIGSAMGRVLSL